MKTTRIVSERTCSWVEDTWRDNAIQIYKQCRTRSSDKENADDLFQEVALRFCKSAPTLDLSGSLYPWFRVVILHTHYSMHRKGNRVMPLSRIREAPVSYDSFTEQEAVHYHDYRREKRIKDELRSFMKVLDPEERLIVELTCLGGLTLADLELRLCISKNRLVKIRNSAFTKMRDMKNKMDIKMRKINAPSLVLEDLLTRFREIS